MPRPDRLPLILATACLLPCPVQAFTPSPPQFPPDTAVQRLLDDRVGGGGAGEVVVGLLELDGTTRIFHAGEAARGVRPLGATTRVAAGWLEPVLTGTLLADMAWRGEVALGEPIGDHGPEHASLTLADLARFESSGRGAGLLGLLLAGHLGLGWEDAVRQRILDPLGMAATTFASSGELYSTPDDLLRFLAANVQLPRTGLQQAMRVAHHPRARLDEERTVALIWRVHDAGGVRTIWHAGRTGSHRAFLGVDPRRGIGVVVLARSGPHVDDLGLHLLNPAVALRSRGTREGGW